MRSMLNYSSLPTSFWSYAMQMSIYILNIDLSKAVSKTHLDLWKGHKPNLRHILIWGCLTNVLKENIEKWEPCSDVLL